ncbi:hypothetical protein [Phaeovulum vinaykumarii]|uniref:Uncharacterized protein n=1 Tax=Phaeovulum vinaykumarii TaxID=407234 RepID=A0A1N7L742_9RHOB|nr:hypothetical protein [Phaeovulum vinaykumarii]SIS69692.1 hypothetical protein SAMN05421795_102644 [Phaeovulum vinaykumarii]SOB99365.1 hypothetical protein SAMN05878426_102128 [Phaeovulum vinaykumarii]
MKLNDCGVPGARRDRAISGAGKGSRLVMAVSVAAALELGGLGGDAQAQAGDYASPYAVDAVGTNLVFGRASPPGGNRVATNAASARRVVISNDRGGVIANRVKQINDLAASGVPVEVKGQVCLSTCTMFVGLPNACIHRYTTFGFHGPSSYGRPLPPESFEYWSQVIASYYPAPLRDWYLREARYEINDLYRIRGAELIRMGVPECGS